jgi:hypothetical protein
MAPNPRKALWPGLGSPGGAFFKIAGLGTVGTWLGGVPGVRGYLKECPCVGLGHSLRWPLTPSLGNNPNSHPYLTSKGVRS